MNQPSGLSLQTAPPRTSPVLSLKDVTVDLPLYNQSARSLRRQVFDLAVGGRMSSRADRIVVIRALDKVTFDVHRGDRIGLLGHNGSGKSTLLKVLSKIYEPTSGAMESRIHVTPLLDASLGLDEEMTGQEAMRIGCLLHGLDRDRLEEAVKDISEFTELGEYLNLPIRTYSTGMKARLVFAIATMNDPEALAVDEGIGAGDARFVAKAQERAGRFIHQAAVFFLASHSEEMLRSFCNKGLVLRSGRMEFLGSMDDAVRFYNHGNY